MVVTAQAQESTTPVISPLYSNPHVLFLTHDAKEKEAWEVVLICRLEKYTLYPSRDNKNMHNGLFDNN